jgi:predicted transcriptional regulator of viral defense system
MGKPFGVISVDVIISAMIRSVGYWLAVSDISYHTLRMANPLSPQQNQAVSLLRERGMARLSELTKVGVTAATVSRMTARGLILRIGRGLYQLPDASLDVNHSLAEAAKLVPKGVICLTSALAFHELTDTIPSRVWMAIGAKDRLPSVSRPPLQFVRFNEKVLTSGIKEHVIEGVRVRIYNPAKTVVDLFRYRRSAGKRYQRSPGLNLALEGLREALRLRKATPSEIARYANEAGVWKVVQPYLEAMIANA